ncbi:hypothetical protein R5R35_001973 [Gryllus longicercus]|uniref:Transmembrane protein 141 n=1 Tax=Gryllus longicercus TaxID=2509291 RepID=A0AAN9VL99_9ORTH
MNDVRKLKEQYKDEHPAFGSYLECMTRTLFGGLAAFTLAFSSAYFAQKGLRKYLPYNDKNFILVSTAVSTGITYFLTSRATKNCQAGWMAAEDKVTYLSDHTPEQK